MHLIYGEARCVAREAVCNVIILTQGFTVNTVNRVYLGLFLILNASRELLFYLRSELLSPVFEYDKVLLIDIKRTMILFLITE